MTPSLSNVLVCAYGPAWIVAGISLPIECNNGSSQPARYVVILSPQPCLTLCEVEVYGKKAINLANGKPTWESSIYSDPQVSQHTVSGSAVDGNKKTNFFDLSCSSTDTKDNNPWWAVDLRQLTNVETVLVTTRGDCCPERNANLVIGLTNISPAKTTPTQSNVLVCAKGPASIAEGVSLAIQCSSPARYVVILSPQPYLTLCEVASG